ncbi:MAG TPA: RsmD family RNA methyltransferase [Phycisphaerales bacterium]|nr:RsmD family RNA methyltransferase [Phycisphaerales bacterium]
MLRIIGGELRRRLIHTPPDAETTRPMPDRVRESVFNLLRGHTEDVEVFDAFAGSGAIGFEALSRGARHVIFVERERRVAALIERTATELGVLDRCEIVVGDTLGAAAVARCPEGVHLVFFDPPYPIVRDPRQWPRVRDQFGRLIQRLDASGYGILRTPWPFLHEIGGPEEEKPAAPARDPRPEPEETDEFEDFAGWEEIDEDDVGGEVEVIDLNEETPRPVRIPVDLRIGGAIGPETHVYGFTAVHLYMRDPAGTGAG